VAGQFVSGNDHAVVGAPTILGRGFVSEPDRRPGATLAAVISDEYWTTRFARDASVIGKTLTVDGRAISIAGVTARGFRGLNSGGRVDITLPMSVMALDTPEFFDEVTAFRLCLLGGLLLVAPAHRPHSGSWLGRDGAGHSRRYGVIEVPHFQELLSSSAVTPSSHLAAGRGTVAATVEDALTTSYLVLRG
jgi:hypothetical protein